MEIDRTARRRAGLHDLVIVVILLSASVTVGLLYGAGAYDRISGYLDVMDGEVVSATAIYRQADESLHLRIDFRHIIGPGFDRVAVSEIAGGGWSIERSADPLVAEHSALRYDAVGWGHLNPTTTTTAWPANKSATWPTAGVGNINVYQRVGDSDLREGMVVSDGGTVTLEFVMVGVTMQPASTLGVSIEYGSPVRTIITGVGDVALYAP